jgi:hypothetical protein
MSIQRSWLISCPMIALGKICGTMPTPGSFVAGSMNGGSGCGRSGTMPTPGFQTCALPIWDDADAWFSGFRFYEGRKGVGQVGHDVVPLFWYVFFFE